MWLFKSSIGRKFVMAITGIALVLFVTFHVLMNSVALIWPGAYNQICEFLGANWYALIASMGLALLFILHVVYALWLTMQNRAARGNDRYAITSRLPQVEWSSNNMLVLGFVVVAFMAVHLHQFWSKMQLVELMHADVTSLATLGELPIGPAQGTLFLQLAFQSWWTPVVYVLGLVALWFHMTHGFWSMFHTIGWDNNRWLGRLKCIANWWTSVVILLFVAQVALFTVHSHNNYYTENEDLQKQYAEYWSEQATEAVQEFLEPLNAMYAEMYNQSKESKDMAEQMKLQNDFQLKQNEYVIANGQKFIDKAEVIEKAYTKACSKVVPTAEISELARMKQQVTTAVNMPAPNQPQK